MGVTEDGLLSVVVLEVPIVEQSTIVATAAIVVSRSHIVILHVQLGGLAS